MFKKKMNKIDLIVIIAAILAVIIVITFIFFNSTNSNSNNDLDKIILNESGEASYLNLSVPSIKSENDSLTLIEKLEKIKLDSINKSKLNSTGLDPYEKDRNDMNNSFGKLNVRNNKTDNSSFNSNRSNNDYVLKNKYSSRENDAIYNSSFDSKTETNDRQNEEILSNPKTGFFRKNENEVIKNSSINLKSSEEIYACIHTNQIIMNNYRVKFRTTKEFLFEGKKFPVNTIIYGLASIKPNRLLIKIDKINQINIELNVYDSEDSQEGIYVLTPNLNASLSKELKKETLDEEDIESIPFSKSLKNIFEKKIREEKVELINNYKVIIKFKKNEK